MSEKEAYQEKLKAQLKEWQAKIDILQARAEKANAEVKLKYYRQVDDLRVKRDLIQKRYEELRHTGEDAWREIKTGLEKSRTDIKEAFERAAKKFK